MVIHDRPPPLKTPLPPAIPAILVGSVGFNHSAEDKNENNKEMLRMPELHCYVCVLLVCSFPVLQTPSLRPKDPERMPLHFVFFLCAFGSLFFGFSVRVAMDTWHCAKTPVKNNQRTKTFPALPLDLWFCVLISSFIFGVASLRNLDYQGSHMGNNTTRSRRSINHKP